MLAHDMRNPLAAIVANLSFLDHACRDADREVRETIADLQDIYKALSPHRATIALGHLGPLTLSLIHISEPTRPY